MQEPPWLILNPPVPLPVSHACLINGFGIRMAAERGAEVGVRCRQ